MKKKKYILTIILMILTICQITCKSIAYTREEVTEMTGYKILHEGEKPDKYDILIYLDDFESNERIPFMKTSIDTILYKKYGLFDINFFKNEKKTNTSNGQTGNSSNNGIQGTLENVAEKLESVDEKWENIQNVVSTVFKFSRYIVFAAMLTLLIYIALILISNSGPEKNFLPMSKQILAFSNKLKANANVQKKAVEVRLVEQWFKSFIVIAIIPYLLSTMVYFSDFIRDKTYKSITDSSSNSTSQENEDIDINYVTVYSKYRVKPVGPANVSYNSTTQYTGGAFSGDIQSLLEETNGAKWSVYALDLSNNRELANINGNTKMSSASVIKLFIAAAYFDKFGENSNADNEQIRIMINNSDNTAANNFIKRSDFGMSAINTYIKDHGYSQTELNRKMLDTNSSTDNYTSAQDVAKLLSEIYNNKIAGSNKILTYMKEQRLRGKIPAGLPSGVVSGNKTGELNSEYSNGIVENDSAIIFTEKGDYALVVMSSNIDDKDSAINKIKEISRKIYDNYISETTDSNDSSTTIENSIATTNSTSNSAISSQEKHIVAVDAGHGVQEYAGSYEQVQAGAKYYTNGASAVYNGVTWTEWETVQKVVDKVIELMPTKYPNITVKQTGRNKPNSERLNLAKQAKAELYIGVHLNSSDNKSASGSLGMIRRNSK